MNEHVRISLYTDTYQIIKKRGHKIYSNWKRSGQHNGDLKTKEGISDWCLAFCDGCKWDMYMAFQFEETSNLLCECGYSLFGLCLFVLM
jgi:hypothetical protein